MLLIFIPLNEFKRCILKGNVTDFDIFKTNWVILLNIVNIARCPLITNLDAIPAWLYWWPLCPWGFPTCSLFPVCFAGWSGPVAWWHGERSPHWPQKWSGGRPCSTRQRPQKPSHCHWSKSAKGIHTALMTWHIS